MTNGASLNDQYIRTLILIKARSLMKSPVFRGVERDDVLRDLTLILAKRLILIAVVLDRRRRSRVDQRREREANLAERRRHFTSFTVKTHALPAVSRETSVLGR